MSTLARSRLARTDTPLERLEAAADLYPFFRARIYRTACFAEDLRLNEVMDLLAAEYALRVFVDNSPKSRWEDYAAACDRRNVVQIVESRRRVTQ